MKFSVAALISGEEERPNQSDSGLGSRLGLGLLTETCIQEMLVSLAESLFLPL